MTPNLKSRNFTWTWFFPEGSLEIPVLQKDFLTGMECLWLICQVELCPTTGRLHLQGAVTFPNALTLKGAKKKFFLLRSAHLEIMIGTPKNSQVYCTKMESRAPGKCYWALETGTVPSPGTRTDILKVMEYSKTHTVRQCWDEFPLFMFRMESRIVKFKTVMAPRQNLRPTVEVRYGPTGTGKSHTTAIAAEAKAIKNDWEIYIMPTPTNASRVPWVDGYMGHEIVIIEDFDGSMNYRILLRVLDQYPMQMEVKGAFVQWCPKMIYFTSNKHPREWYPAEGYEDGPLERRLNDGTIIKMEDVYIEPKI